MRVHRPVFIFLLLAHAWGADDDFNGRWAIATENNRSGRVFWLEVKGAGAGKIEGWFVGGPGGGIDPLLDAKISGGELSFKVERYVGAGADRRFATTVSKARLVNGEMHGATQQRDREIRWVGRRAPELAETDDGTWHEAAPVVLFDGSGLDQWRTLKPGRENGWSVQDGVLRNVPNADLLVSRRKFWNFKLRAEHQLLPRSNSGIGLRGRYEVQILDDYRRPPSKNGHGAVYSRIAPRVNASRPPGQWQTLEVTLVGRQVSVTLNGAKVIDKQQIDGFTAMASDPHAGEPGPITIQGDHGTVEFRKIVVTPLTKEPPPRTF